MSPYFCESNSASCFSSSSLFRYLQHALCHKIKWCVAGRLHLEQHYNGHKSFRMKNMIKYSLTITIGNGVWLNATVAITTAAHMELIKSSKRSEKHFEQLHAMKKISQELRFKKFVFLCDIFALAIQFKSFLSHILFFELSSSFFLSSCGSLFYR